MMRKKTVSLLGALSISCSLSGNAVVQADWPSFKQECKTDQLRNNAWPQPFRAMDANSVANPFEVMKANGWREFNTVTGAFFDASNQLTEAGQLKIRQILITSPPNRRSIHVLKGDTPEQTSVRVESVEVAVSGFIPTGDLPPIMLTDVEPAMSSGAYQTVVNRAIIRTTPTPRLPPPGNLSQASQLSTAPGAAQAGAASGGK
jgi:hypothetical protein